MTLADRFIWKPGDIILLGKREKRHRPGGHDHDQSTHAPKTRPAGKGEAEDETAAPQGEGTKESPVVTDDVEEAARLLGEGKYVQLKSTEQVATLLDRLKAIADDAFAKGEEAPNYDLCKVTVPGTNVFCVESKGIPRIQMPQLKAKTVTPGSPADDFERDKDGEVDLYQAFLAHLEDTGIGAAEDMIDARYLKASQSELNGVKVGRMMSAIKAGKFDPRTGNPMIVSRDNYVVDGHHRWAAVVGMEYSGVDLDIPVLKVDMDILDLLREANAYSAEMGIPQQGFRYRVAFHETRACGHGGCAMPGPFAVVDAVIRHHPGGHDHDQTTHGNWAEGTATDLPDLPVDTGLSGLPPEARDLILKYAQEGFGDDFPATPEEMASLLDELYGMATPEEVRAGLDWYDTANRMARQYSEEYGVDFDTACAIIARTSPGREWDSNIELARRVMAVYSEDAPFEIDAERYASVRDTAGMHGPGMYRPSDLTPEQLAWCHPEFKDKALGKTYEHIPQTADAIRLARGEMTPDEALGGPKIRNFYNNIHDPEDPRFVTIDTWQVRASLPGEGVISIKTRDGVTTLKTRTKGPGEGKTVDVTVFTSKPSLTRNKQPILKTGMYSMFAEAVMLAAKRREMLPNECQAITWLVLRRLDA